MIFPIEEVAKYKGGMYAMTVAASKRALQLATLAGIEGSDEDDLVNEENDGKAVSVAAQQLFSGELTYSIEAPR